MPSIAPDVMAMLDDSRSAAKDIVGKLQLDQAMGSNILKTCNSALQGIRTEVTSISRTVGLLGFADLNWVLTCISHQESYSLL